MKPRRYGVKYPDGTYTGGITDHHHAAAAYARVYKATVYEVGGKDDPELRQAKSSTGSDAE